MRSIASTLRSSASERSTSVIEEEIDGGGSLTSSVSMKSQQKHSKGRRLDTEAQKLWMRFIILFALCVV